MFVMIHRKNNETKYYHHATEEALQTAARAIIAHEMLAGSMALEIGHEEKHDLAVMLLDPEPEVFNDAIEYYNEGNDSITIEEQVDGGTLPEFSQDLKNALQGKIDAYQEKVRKEDQP